MKIKIKRTEYKLVFNYHFTRYVMQKNGIKTFSEYGSWLGKFNIGKDDFGPDSLDLLASLVYDGIACHRDNLKIVLDDILEVFWQDLSLLQKVFKYFESCQPKNSSANPDDRGN